MVWMLVSLCLLTGCASLLERTYSKVEPHSSRFWESEAADTLRAENYQDIVNDLLILIGQHTESASLRLYNFEDDLAAAAAMEQAAAETQQETPLGAYAVEYMTSAGQSAGDTMRRQSRSVIAGQRSRFNPWSTPPARRRCTVCWMPRWTREGQSWRSVSATGERMAGNGGGRRGAASQRARTGRDPHWQVNYYPDSGQVGLVEFLMDSETTAAMAAPPPKDQAGETGDAE